MDKLLTTLGLREEDPKELARKWQRELRAETRSLDRQLRDIAREEAKCRLEIKRLAKVGGQQQAIKSLAKEIVQARKAAERITVAKMHVNSCAMQVRQAAAQLRMQKVFESSVETMKALNAAVNIPETQGRLRELGVEMMKAGLIQEMADEAMDEAFADDAVEADVDAEVDRVVAELTMSALDRAKAAPTAAVPVSTARGQAILEKALSEPDVGHAEEEEDEEEEDSELEKRLAALQSS